MQRRWFQFRLRTLLGLVVLVCLVLGGWQLYWTYFGPFVQAEPAAVGQPIKIRGRFFDFRGLKSTVYTVKISKPMADGRPVICQSGSGFATRRGWWVYDVEIELAPLRKPGKYDVELHPLTQALYAALRSKLPGAADRVRPVIRSKLSVPPADEIDRSPPRGE